MIHRCRSCEVRCERSGSLSLLLGIVQASIHLSSSSPPPLLLLSSSSLPPPLSLLLSPSSLPPLSLLSYSSLPPLFSWWGLGLEALTLTLTLLSQNLLLSLGMRWERRGRERGRERGRGEERRGEERRGKGLLMFFLFFSSAAKWTPSCKLSAQVPRQSAVG